MSDMLSLGASGINAYQRALATVSNNIANVATDGYSRQTVSFQSTTPKALGTNYIGTGVSVEAIVRQYDAFVESNLRGSLSDLKSQSPLVNYANRVVDLMADESTSLSLTIGKFFSSARDLAAEPASLIARNVFLRSADSTASSFRLIAEQLNAIETESRIGIGDIPKSVNTLAEQLSLVNKQLGRTPLLENQPAELLDERDRLLRQMSEQVRINTQFATNGEVKVSLTDNFDQGVIVERDKAQTLGLEVSGDNRVALVLNPYSPDKRETLGSLGGGTLGGLLAFREQVLKPMQENLNLLAKTFMNEVNAIHRQGVDAMGRPGEDLFTLSSSSIPVARHWGSAWWIRNVWPLQLHSGQWPNRSTRAHRWSESPTANRQRPLYQLCSRSSAASTPTPMRVCWWMSRPSPHWQQYRQAPKTPSFTWTPMVTNGCRC